MPGFKHGISRTLFELLSFLIIGLLLRIVLEIIGWRFFAELLYLALCLTPLKIIEKMKYWSTSYLAGYLLAQLAIVYMTPDPVSISVTLTGLAIFFGRLIKNVL